MTGSITKRTILSAEPTGKIYYVRDSQLTGFAIKVTAKGKVSFVVEVRIKGGKPFRKELGNVDHLSLKDAQAQYYEIVAKAKKGIDPRFDLDRKAPANQTVLWCLEEHIRHRQVRDTTARTYRNQANNAFKDWLNRPAETINEYHVQEKRTKLLEQYSEEYVKACFRMLGAVLAQADLQINPVRQLHKKTRNSLQSKPTQKVEVLFPADIANVLLNIHSDRLGDEDYINDDGEDVYLGFKPKPSIWHAILYLLLIGGRKQDAVNLTWDMVDLEKQLISYSSKQKKENKPFIIPMIGMIEDVIRSQPKHLQHPNLVFGMSNEMFRKRFDDEVRPLINNTAKSLRKTWAEHMALEGYDPNAIGQGLNHSQANQGVTSSHYAKNTLLQQKRLKEMYLKLQLRYLYYALGEDYDIEIENADLKEANIEKTFSALSQFPSFLRLLNLKSPDALKAFIEDKLFQTLEASYIANV